MVENGATTTYAAANNLNQYPTVGGVGATYDGNGNLKTYNGWTYTYDAMNRLTAASKTGASATFHYDGLNRQITRNFNGNGLVYFSVWAGWDLVEEYTQGDALYASYLQGAQSDELISMTRSGQAYYFFQDGRGNTSQVANSSGQLVETCKYDVHGEPAITVAPGSRDIVPISLSASMKEVGFSWETLKTGGEVAWLNFIQNSVVSLMSCFIFASLTAGLGGCCCQHYNGAYLL